MKKQLTKTLAIILSLVMLLSVVPATVSAATIVDSGTCGENIAWSLDYAGTLTIIGTGIMLKDSDNKVPWKTYAKIIKNVIISDGVTSIGAYAFSFCESLQSITIPNTVTSIGAGAFEYCESLQSITIPNTVTSIGAYAFYSCYSLQSITIPKSVTSIGENAFLSYGKVDVYIEDLTKWLAIEFFNDYSNPLHTPGESNLYLNGEKLTDVIIPDSVTSIKEYTFIGCSSLQTVIIPDSVTSIENSAFRDCDNLKSISIPNTVTSIGAYAFYGCSSLQNIIIPDTVTSIGDSAFSGCYGLLSITIGDSVTSIGSYAFFLCTSLQNIIIPSSVTYLGFRAFNGCSGLQSVIIGKGVTIIESQTFSGNDRLESIIIPDSVTQIEDNFYDCGSLVNVYFCGTEEQWNNISFFYDLEDLENAKIHFTEHKYKYTTVVTAPTCTAKGYTTYTCACGHTYKDNEVNAKGHTYTSKITTDPTHTKEGVETFTCYCGDSYTKSIAKLTAHTYTSVVTAPTCTAKGYTTYTCACGHTYKDNEVNANGHTYTSKVTKQPTYTAEGVETFTCACGDRYTRAIAKLTVAFTDSGNAKNDGKNVVMNVGLTPAQLLSQASKGAIIKDSKGNSLAANKAVGTGMKLVLPDGKEIEIVVCGDVDGDGTQSASDARLALRGAVGLEKYSDDSCYRKAAMVADGKTLSASDARMILRASVGLEKLDAFKKN